jgi:HEAT repeat protein
MVILGLGAALLVAAAVGPEPVPWTVLDTAGKCSFTETRLQSVAALETLGAENRQAVQRLVAFLKKDKDARVRKAAALALGRMKAQEAIPELKSALKDTDEVAFGAAQALMNLGDPAGRQMLVAVLDGERSDSPGIMTNAKREAERRIHHPAGTALFGAEGAVGSFIGPGYMGIEAITDTNSLRGKPDPGRIAAIHSLAKDPDAYAVTLLEWALSNSSAPVRTEAAKGLGERGNAGSVAKLQPLLKDSHGDVRTMAAASIIRLTARPAEVRLDSSAPADAAGAKRQ